MEADERVKKITDPKLALIKAEHYCAYQERAQQEVRDKLYEWGLYPAGVEQVIADLITGNFLNEERFAKAFVKGKFSQKSWGRVKIKQALKFKRIPEVLIKKALLIIDGDTYVETLKKVIDKKASVLHEKDTFKKNYKLKQYALGRGFENDLINDVLKDSDL